MSYTEIEFLRFVLYLLLQRILHCLCFHNKIALSYLKIELLLQFSITNNRNLYGVKYKITKFCYKNTESIIQRRPDISGTKTTFAQFN